MDIFLREISRWARIGFDPPKVRMIRDKWPEFFRSRVLLSPIGIVYTYFAMNPYAQPNERKVGAQRPKISHLPSVVETRTRQQRKAEKLAVAAERRAIKKSARRHLKKQMLSELEQTK